MILAVSALKRGILLPLIALLAACQLFAPAYDPEVGTRTSDAYTAVSQLMSEAEYGKFQDPASFTGVIDRYAQIDALLMTASASAGVLPTSAKPAEKARTLLVRQIDGCRDRVRAVAKIHKREGIAPNAGLTEDARVACDLAARAANAMKK
jgi:hypothetical protein